MYVPRVSDIQIGDDTILKPVSQQTVPSHVSEKKYIICESSSDCLFCMLPCSECSENVNESGIVKGNVSSGLFVKLFCANGHQVLEWNSQPFLGKMPSVTCFLQQQHCILATHMLVFLSSQNC